MIFSGSGITCGTFGQDFIKFLCFKSLSEYFANCKIDVNIKMINSFWPKYALEDCVALSVPEKKNEPHQPER